MVIDKDVLGKRGLEQDRINAPDKTRSVSTMRAVGIELTLLAEPDVEWGEISRKYLYLNDLI